MGIKLINHTVLLLISLSLVACGGGGGSGGGGGDSDDTTPDAFSFTDQTGVDLLTEVTSNTISVTGIDAAASMSVTGGEYAIDGGSFTSTNGTISAGQDVVVRQTSSDQFSTTTDATLTIGGVSDTFSVTTLDEDLDPNAFSFNDQTDVARSTSIVSNTVTVTGINSSAPISIADGEYSIDGGAFASTASTITNNQQVQVRQTSSTDFSTTTDAVLTIGGQSDTFSITTLAEDLEPDAFTFTDQTGIPLDTVVESNTVTIDGINNAAPISITGGEYSIDGGTYTSASGTVNNGQQVTVSLTSSSAYLDTVTATLTISSVSDDFDATTQAPPPDTIPDVFSFNDQADVPLSTVVESNVVTITGINTETAISISGNGGEYSIDGGAYTSTAGTINSGQTVQVRQTSSTNNSTSTDTTLDVGGVTETFSVTTIDDTTPDTFTFTDQTDVPLSTPIESNTVTVTGINTATPISISGNSGEYRIDGGAYTSTGGTINEGQAVQVRQTSSADFSSSTNTTLTIGDVDDIFTITTLDEDNTPDQFTFNDESDVRLNSLKESNQITVLGINNVTSISVNGGEYRINGGSPTANVGTVNVGDIVSVLQTSSSSSLTQTDVILSIGSITDTYSVTTANDVTPPTVNVIFPSTQSMTDGNSIKVRGTASDDLATISTLSVNGVNAQTSDGFSNWTADVPLSDAANNLTVAVSDVVGNTDSSAATLSVDKQEPALGFPRGITVDSVNDRALIADMDVDSILAVDLTTEERTNFSSSANVTPGDIYAAHRNPKSMVIDYDQDRILMADITRPEIVAIDINTGEPSIAFTGTNYTVPAQDLAIDNTNNQLLVIYPETNAVVAFNLDTGIESIISDINIDPNNPLEVPTGIVVDGGRALVTNNPTAGGPGSIVAVDIDSGTRTILSDNSTPSGGFDFNSLVDIDIDGTNAYVVTGFSSGIVGGLIVRVDLSTGFRTLFSASNFPGLEPVNYQYIVDVAVDTTNNRLLVADLGSQTDKVIAVDLTSQVRSNFSSDVSTFAAVNERFQGANGMALDTTNNRLLVAERRAIGPTIPNYGNNVKAIDIATSNYDVVSGYNTPDLTNLFEIPQRIINDALNDRYVVTDAAADTLYFVDPSDGSRTLVSTSPNGGLRTGLKLDVVNNLAYMTEQDPPQLVVANMTTGAVQVLSSNTYPNTDNPFFQLFDLELDLTNNQIYVFDSTQIFTVDATTGQRTQVVTTGDAASQFISITSGLLDSDNNRLIITDNGLDMVIAVDLDTGARTVLSQGSDSNGYNVFSYATQVIIDPTEPTRAWVSDRGVTGIMLLDLETGERVYFSR